MCAFCDFARLDLFQGVYPLAISIEGVHEMHTVWHLVSSVLNIRIGVYYTSRCLSIGAIVIVVKGEKARKVDLRSKSKIKVGEKF